jgi:peptide/nickel transport system permease protein
MTSRAGRIAGRLGALALTVVLATLLAHAVLDLAEGDRARAVAAARYGGEGAADAALVEAVRAELGLDRPLTARYAEWAAAAVRGDLGRSFVTGEPVADTLARAAALTVPVALAAFLLGLACALPLGVLAALRPGGAIDRAAVALASLGAAVPSFWLGLLLILWLAVDWRLLPAYGAGSPSHLVLPAATLAVWVTAAQTRLLRSFLREALAAPHLDALRLRGVGEARLLIVHVAPPVLVAMAPALVLELAGLVEGAVVVEVVFARPGLGLTFVEALRARDIPVILGFVALAVMLYAAANALADALARGLDPRLREAASG